jgi:hypothetical protein
MCFELVNELTCRSRGKNHHFFNVFYIPVLLVQLPDCPLEVFGFLVLAVLGRRPLCRSHPIIAPPLAGKLLLDRLVPVVFLDVASNVIRLLLALGRVQVGLGPFEQTLSALLVCRPKK